MKFKDKLALVTGAGSGIGRSCALLFALEGANVIVSDFNEKSGLETVALIQAENGIAHFIQADVSKWPDMEALHQEIKEKFGVIDIAINNAGIAGTPALTADTALEEWERIMATNSTSVFYGMKLQIAMMLKQGGGIIVNTASIAGLRGLPRSIAYTASKHAVVGMTKTASMEYGKKNIRINAVCPAFTVTQLFNPELMDSFSAGLSDKLKKSIPINRFADVDEIANSILWLCSEKASFVHGLALPVDGGLTA